MATKLICEKFSCLKLYIGFFLSHTKIKLKIRPATNITRHIVMRKHLFQFSRNFETDDSEFCKTFPLLLGVSEGSSPDDTVDFTTMSYAKD